MKELAEDRIPVTVTCRVLKLSRQPYYRWLVDPTTDSEIVEAHRANALFDAHHDDPEFGHRLLADEARQAGEAMADRTAWRICRDNAWWSSFGKKRGRNGKKPGPAVHDDLCTVTDENGRVRHEFSAERPNQLWLTDITEHRTTTQGKQKFPTSKLRSPIAVNHTTGNIAAHRDGVVQRVHGEAGLHP